MQLMDSGKDKVRKICEALKKETLDPARKEAEEIVENARKEAEGMIHRAKVEGEKLVASAKAKIEEEKRVFNSALHMGAKQALASLRQAIEEKLFSEQLHHLVAGKMGSPDAVANCIAALIASAGEGEVVLPKGVDRKEVASSLLSKGLEKIAQGGMHVGEFAGGAQLKLIGKHITLDLSDEAISGLLASYIREDFRHLLFGSK